MTELDPCPFCGSDNVDVDYCSESFRAYSGQCNACECEGPAVFLDGLKGREVAKQDAADKWNKRIVPIQPKPFVMPTPSGTY